MESKVTSHDDLIDKMGYTVEERAAILTNDFDGIKVTKNFILDVFKKHKIKKKAIRVIKALSPVAKQKEAVNE